MKPFTSTALKVDETGLWILDQTKLPQEEIWIESGTPATMVQIIRELRVRGAPLIGVAAALQLALLVERGGSQSEFESAWADLRAARPTAVNLMNALDRLMHVCRTDGLRSVPLAAQMICDEDVALCERMVTNGVALIGRGERLLTHCNSGALATAGAGTALGAILRGAREGLVSHVYVDETRPLLQGGRLTTWELAKAAVPHTLICDSMAGFLMQKGQVDRVMVGADRIAANGDFANKIGTYGLAVLCRHHGIPFHVVAPQTTVDPACADGAGIPIEQRPAAEVHGGRAAADVWNPAFDVTPAGLVTSWVLDTGVYRQGEFKCSR
ncbi:MAG TPA: S-methyl-5-thioribose-1-phosphate isomerase [Bdellovibrionales bacterium]|nr:S-methyl-5-thioribose-1-phosphate isomerase [Bdellovibrionales bacterium]